MITNVYLNSKIIFKIIDPERSGGPKTRGTGHITTNSSLIGFIRKYYTGLIEIRRLRFEAKRVEQREIKKEVDRMTRPRKGDKSTILIIGNAARKNIFGKTKGNTKGMSQSNKYI